MDLVDKVGRTADAHEGAPGVDVIEPAIKFLVILEGDQEATIVGFQ